MMIDPQQFVMIVILALVVGLTIGVFGATWLQDRAAVRWSRYALTGRLDTMAANRSRLPGVGRVGPVAEDVPQEVRFTPESTAQSRALEAVRSRGAAQLMEANPRLTRAQALERADQLLKKSGAFKLHGTDVPAVGE